MEVTTTCDGDCELFRHCLSRQDPEAWREFIARCDVKLRRILRWTLEHYGVGLVEDGRDLEDFLQELYCRLLQETAQRFRGHSDVEMWVFLRHAARNLVVDHRRASYAEKRWQGTSGDDAEKAALPRTTTVVEARLQWRDLRRHLLLRCHGIVAAGRARLELRALHLTVFEGWSSRETSRLLGAAVSPCRVDFLVCRLRQQLAQDGLQIRRRRLAEWPIAAAAAPAGPAG